MPCDFTTCSKCFQAKARVWLRASWASSPTLAAHATPAWTSVAIAGQPQWDQEQFVLSLLSALGRSSLQAGASRAHGMNAAALRSQVPSDR